MLAGIPLYVDYFEYLNTVVCGEIVNVVHSAALAAEARKYVVKHRMSKS
jgi:hypothetical protein